MALIRSGERLSYEVPRENIREFPPSTPTKGGSREAYPGFSAKDLAARDVFAADLGTIWDKQAETQASMLKRFDVAVRTATAAAARHPENFEGSDRYLASLIAQEESAAIKRIRKEAQDRKTHDASVILALQEEVSELRSAYREEQRKLTERGHEYDELHRAYTYLDKTIRPLEGVRRERLHGAHAAVDPISNWPTPRRTIKNITFPGLPSPLKVVKSSNPKEKLPMSKLKIAAGIAAAVVLMPLAYNTTKSQWGTAIADFTPGPEATIEERLAELSLEQREALVAYAHKRKELEDAQAEAEELMAFEREFLMAYDMSSSELEDSLALVGQE
jgi:hypothetical protein